MSPNDAVWPDGPARRQAAEAPVYPGRGFSASAATEAVISAVVGTPPGVALRGDRSRYDLHLVLRSAEGASVEPTIS